MANQDEKTSGTDGMGTQGGPGTQGGKAVESGKAARVERATVIHEGLPTQLPDIDPDETHEWLESLDEMIDGPRS